MLELSNVPLPLDAGLSGAAGRRALHEAVGCALGVSSAEVAQVRVLKRSVDARKKSNVHFVATVAVSLADADLEQAALASAQTSAAADAEGRCMPSERAVAPKGLSSQVRLASGVNIRVHERPIPLDIPDCRAQAAAAFAAGAARPVVVGTGPAGLFAALYLAQAGLQPLVLERGAAVDERVEAVESFAAGGPLNPQANIQFGEGGAGTFSDGKLNTGTKSPHIRHVLQAFADAGAPDEILWQAKPHIGTDKLVGVVRTLRERIVAAGGEVRFFAQLTGLRFERGVLAAIEVTDASPRSRPPASAGLPPKPEIVPATALVLACGHSARDTFELLQRAGVALERKPFAVGVRIEHPQQLIDRAQYGEAAAHPALGAADYKLAVHLPDGRGVYTFCMCPGGEVVAAASEEGGVCVNGMSRFARGGRNANSALLVEVRPEDLPGDDPLAGVAFQRALERDAYTAAGSGYRAPAQTVDDFLHPQGVAGSHLVKPTYPRGVTWANLHDCLPPFVAQALVQALPLLDRKLRGFAHPQAVMTAVEARSSSPVRIVRGDNLQSVSHAGLYPCGEGAGYAGGITSAAVDGLRVAEALARELVR